MINQKKFFSFLLNCWGGLFSIEEILASRISILFSLWLLLQETRIKKIKSHKLNRVVFMSMSLVLGDAH